MSISFTPDQTKNFIASIDWEKLNFEIEEKSGLALPRSAFVTDKNKKRILAVIEETPTTERKKPKYEL